jgi:hypothetical protein
MKPQPYSITLSNRAACHYFALDGWRLRPFRAVAADASRSTAVANLLANTLSHNFNRLLFAGPPHWAPEPPT